MPTTVEWSDLALRLALTVAAGILFGFNRSEHGHAAGLRTTLLVCLAASVAMIQANLILSTRGKTEDSFVQMDVMRMPLGILTGMGFIGGGAILRRGQMIRGVTTAATLWLVTVIGLCFGGGQIVLGVSATVLGMVVLRGLHWVEGRMVVEQRATLVVRACDDGPGEEEIQTLLRSAGLTVASWSVACQMRDGARRHTFRAEVKWQASSAGVPTPALVHQLAQHPGVLAVQWKM